MKCFSRKIYKKYKSHNLTKKHFYDFKHNITKYLSPKQIMSLKCNHNDILKYKNKKNMNYNSYSKKITQIHSYKPRQMKSILSNIMKHIHPTKETLFINQNEEFYSITTNYPIYYYKKNKIVYKVLDINILSKGFSYFHIGHIEMNPSCEYIIFNVDFIGNRVYHLFLKHIFCDEITELNTFDPKKRMMSVHETLNQTPNNSDFFIWLDDKRISYTINNSYYNTNKTYIYNIHSHNNKLLYKSNDTFVEVKSTNNYNILYDSDYNSDEIYLIEDNTTTILIKRQKDVCYPFIEHYDGIWYIHESNKGNDIIKSTQNFITFNILYKNNNPCEKITQIENHFNKLYFIISNNSIYRLDDKLEKILDIDSIYFIRFGNIFCNKLEFIRHSYLSPKYIQYYNTETNYLSKYKKINQPYIEKNVYIHSMLYFTLMYKKGHSLKKSKFILYGYGSYGDDFDRGYLPFIFELLDRGFMVAFAHIRGGGEFGFKGYNEGRLLNKKNTFLDFIEIIKYLYKHNYTTKELLTIWGRSAGGLLISCVLNIEPDICHLALLGVPFITPILTMKDKHNPLGFESHSEFGNPFIPEHLKYLESYDPLSHINVNGNYPNIFIYTNLNDTLVPYKEPLMYYEALKKVNVFKENKKELNLFIDPLYGHIQGSSSMKKQESFARIIDVIYKSYKIEMK
jgi:oligopeptidase B